MYFGLINFKTAIFANKVHLLQVDLLASGASLFGREAADREPRSRESSRPIWEVTRHMKSDEGFFWKSTNKANFSEIFLQSFPTHFSSQWVY